MAFIQFKLDQSIGQSRDIFNKYIYEPDNGDSSTDVAQSGYWSESRFIDDPSWDGSVIEMKLSNGYFIGVVSGGDMPLVYDVSGQPVNPNAFQGFSNYINGDQTPITLPAGVPTLLTLTTSGGAEIEEFLPVGVSGLWDSDNSQFDFSSLNVGDMVDIRLDGSLTTTTINDSFLVNLVAGIGSPGGGFTLPFASGNRFIAGVNSVSRYNGIYIGSDDIKNFPAQFEGIASDDASGFLIDIYVKILRGSNA